MRASSCGLVLSCGHPIQKNDQPQRKCQQTRRPCRRPKPTVSQPNHSWLVNSFRCHPAQMSVTHSDWQHITQQKSQLLITLGAKVVCCLSAWPLKIAMKPDKLATAKISSATAAPRIVTPALVFSWWYSFKDLLWDWCCGKHHAPNYRFGIKW